jgi:hypothetical protein
MPTADAPASEAATVEAENLPAFLDEDESAVAGNPSEPRAVAAE